MNLAAAQATAQAGFTPGSIVKNYRVIRELQRGGTAVVYEADSTQTGLKVALKVMCIQEGKGMPAAAIQREIAYASALQHENIVRLLDYFLHEEQHVVIVWELIEGVDLLDLLNEHGGRFEEGQAAFYFAQLLRGVLAIHSRGLCHRDLKPENCMVEKRTQRLKIIDFGLSKKHESAITLGVGTPDYMAPEMISGGCIDVLYNRGTGRYDPAKTDVWALGCLLFLLVTGQYPFEDPLQPQNIIATLTNISLGRSRPLPRRSSPQVTDLIKSMICLDPAQRISLQDIAAHPWLAMHGHRVCASPATTSSPPTDSLLRGSGIPPASSADMEVEESQESQQYMSAESSLAGGPPLQPSVVGPSTPTLSTSWGQQEPLPLIVAAPRVPSFNFLPGQDLLVKSKCPTSPHTPKVVLMAEALSQPPLTVAPPAMTAVRPPIAPYPGKTPVVPAFTEGVGHLRALVPAQSLECSPTAQQASKQHRGFNFGGFCSWFVGRSSPCGDGLC